MSNKPQYWGASGGLEYEAAWALGAANGVKDLETLQYATMLCNEEGSDPISFGATLGAVMELYEMGVLTKEQLGIEAPFGSAATLAFLAEETIYIRASVWRTPRRTAAAVIYAATPSRLKCWAFLSRPIRWSMRASLSW